MNDDDGISWKELLEIFGGSTPDMIRFKYITATSHEQRLHAVEAAIDWIVAEMSKSARHNADSTEDALTTQIVINLRAIGFQASHDADVGGHCDIVVEGVEKFLWLAEAKIHGSYKWLFKGFQQLTTRYSTGMPGQDAGAMIIYCKGPRIDRMMSAWSKHLVENQPGAKIFPCDGNPTVFVSLHIHVRTGARFKVRHVPVSLYFDPKDRAPSGEMGVRRQPRSRAGGDPPSRRS
jgi:hypothetical protein